MTLQNEEDLRRASAFADQVSVSRRLIGEIFIGDSEYNTVTDAVKAAYLAGMTDARRADQEATAQEAQEAQEATAPAPAPEHPNPDHLIESYQVNTIRHIQNQSKTRALRWHRGKPSWSLLEWAGAMCGEAGESANFAKKLKRIDEDLQNIDGRDYRSPGRSIHEETLHMRRLRYKRAAVKEAADAILYALCLASEAEIDMEDVVIQVFNEKSEEYGFPERLHGREAI